MIGSLFNGTLNPENPNLDRWNFVEIEFPLNCKLSQIWMVDLFSGMHTSPALQSPGFVQFHLYFLF